MKEYPTPDQGMIYQVSMVIKAKRMNEEGLLLLLLQDFPDVTVKRFFSEELSRNLWERMKGASEKLSTFCLKRRIVLARKAETFFGKKPGGFFRKTKQMQAG